MESTHIRFSRTRRWVLQGLLALVSVVLVLALAEMVARVAADRPWHERIEDQADHGQIASVPIGSKRYKLRQGLPADPVHDANTHRILFLGDSFTYGSGIEDPQAVFPALVTKRLQALEPEASNRRFEFFNGGIPGSLTGRWVQLHELLVEPLAPNSVVVVFFLRDGTRKLGSRAKLRAIRRPFRQFGLESFFLKNSYLFRAIFERAIQHEISRNYLEALEKAYLGDDQETEEWRNAQANLLTLRDAARERGSDFALVIFPLLYRLDGDYPLANVMDEIYTFAETHGIATLSLLPAFQSENDADLWISKTDQHPNERGHAIAADAIANFLRSQRITH